MPLKYPTVIGDSMENIYSADLFVPGRSSYVTQTQPGAAYKLHLSQASIHRAAKARDLFESDFHDSALFAGGYPGVAQNWPAERVPEASDREANLMARLLIDKLSSQGFSSGEIAKRVKQQGDSNNSIGDVAHSMQRNYLDPNKYNTQDRHGIHLVAGALHGYRFRMILSKALDMDPKHIVRADMQDTYGTPATQFQPRELAPVALAKEYAAIALTAYVLRDVEPGNMHDLFAAEERFTALATRNN
jgi:hypothetical protein